MVFSLRERLLILIFILAILSGVVYKFVYSPLNYKISQETVKSEQIKADILEQKKLNQEEDKLREKIALLNDEKIITKQQIPLSPQMESVVRFIDKTAQEEGLKLLSLNYSENENAVSSLVSVDFNMAISGSPSSVIAFIEKMEQSDRLFVFSDLVLRTGEAEDKGSGENGTSIMDKYDKTSETLELNFSCYYEKEQGNLLPSDNKQN